MTISALSDAGVAVLDCEHKTPSAQERGHPYIAIPDIQDGRVVLATTRRISGDDLAEWTRRTVPRAGDIVVTRRGRVGDSAPIPDVQCAIGQNLVLLRSDGRNVDQDYLRWAVRSPEWWGEVERLRNVGAVFSSLNVKDIARIRLSFPPLPEQQAIAEVLGALDDKIAANTTVAKASDALMRAEYEAWPDIVLTTVGKVAGSPRVATDPGAVEPTTPYVGLEHIEKRTMWLTDFGSARDVTSGKSSFESADVLFGKLRPYFHKVVSAPMNGICSTDVLVVRALDPAMASVMLAAVASDRVVQAVVAASEGTRMPRTSWKDLAATEIPWPSGPSAKELAGRLDGIRDAALAALVENRTLAATRDALLPQLMSGKLRVRDAEKIVEAST